MSPQGQSIVVQITRAFSLSLQIRVIASFFLVFFSVFLKGTYLGICRMESFAPELDHFYS